MPSLCAPLRKRIVPGAWKARRRRRPPRVRQQKTPADRGSAGVFLYLAE